MRNSRGVSRLNADSDTNLRIWCIGSYHRLRCLLNPDKDEHKCSKRRRSFGCSRSGRWFRICFLLNCIFCFRTSRCRNRIWSYVSCKARLARGLRDSDNCMRDRSLLFSKRPFSHPEYKSCKRKAPDVSDNPEKFIFLLNTSLIIINKILILLQLLLFISNN